MKGRKIWIPVFIGMTAFCLYEQGEYVTILN
jgi:hypothetical protein